MINTAEDLLEEFGHLSALERKKAISMILRLSLEIEIPPFSDEELVLNAEEIFLELDKKEEENDA